MGKATIIEAQNSNTVYEQGSNKGILGKLKGVFADYRNGTRNSDRLYTEELWDNRVFGSEDVMEALETKTLFGELDHPEGDRCETLAKNAAISITKLEKRPEEGVIYGEAEILDTPTGRIVKALADSGAKLGVSSRGMGEEVFVDGQNIIDPDTYDFITFDVVVTPANTKARVELTESKHISKLTESLKKEIESSETENQLNQIKTVCETMNTPNKDELVNLIENKITSLNTVEIPAKLSEANKNIALKLLKQKYEESKAQLDEAISTSASLSEENAKLVEKLDFLTRSRGNIRSKLGDAKEEVGKKEEECKKLSAELEKALNENKALNNTIQSNQEKLTESTKLATEKVDKNTAEYKELLLKSRQIANRKLENLEVRCKEEINALKEDLSSKDEKINKLLESNKEKQLKLNKCAILYKENKSLKEENQKLQESIEANKKKMTESKLQESNKIKALEARIAELEENNSKMEEAQNRFSKMSFDPLGTVKAVAENFSNGEYSAEDIELFNALTGRN